MKLNVSFFLFILSLLLTLFFVCIISLYCLCSARTLCSKYKIQKKNWFTNPFVVLVGGIKYPHVLFLIDIFVWIVFFFFFCYFFLKILFHSFRIWGFILFFLIQICIWIHSENKSPFMHSFADISIWYGLFIVFSFCVCVNNFLSKSKFSYRTLMSQSWK